MMDGRKRSDTAVVAMKPANEAGQHSEALARERGPVEEWGEPRAGAEGNADWPDTHRTQIRGRVPQGLDRIREAARQRKQERFTGLLHHVNVDALRQAYQGLKHDAASGVDGVSWQDYGVDLERQLEDLHGRVHRGAYRPQPSRRTYIPKADGRQRPLAVAALGSSRALSPRC